MQLEQQGKGSTMKMLQRILFCLLVGIHIQVQAGDDTPSMNTVWSRLKMYGRLARADDTVTPQERKAALRTIGRDGAIALGITTAVVIGGVVIAKYVPALLQQKENEDKEARIEQEKKLEQERLEHAKRIDTEMQQKKQEDENDGEEENSSDIEEIDEDDEYTLQAVVKKEKVILTEQEIRTAIEADLSQNKRIYGKPIMLDNERVLVSATTKSISLLMTNKRRDAVAIVLSQYPQMEEYALHLNKISKKTVTITIQTLAGREAYTLIDGKFEQQSIKFVDKKENILNPID